MDLKAWDASFRAHKTIIAVKNGEIVGFGDMDETGYLDRLYVHKDYQGQGIASAICDELERFTAGKTFTTHASIKMCIRDSPMAIRLGWWLARPPLRRTAGWS